MRTVSEQISKELQEKGYTVIPDVFSGSEVDDILKLIGSVNCVNTNFRQSKGLFAIRQFFKEVPHAKQLIFTTNLQMIIRSFFGNDYFIIKSIYFDKPESSNWFVSYHQDLTISVGQKSEVENFSFWTVKNNQFAVQPPVQNLENIFTIRIHLDDTDENNGALYVVPSSHSKGIYRPEKVDWQEEKEECCRVKRGGIMIMKPLLLHRSDRTISNSKRRVIHIEFSDMHLPASLSWAEKENI